MCACVPNLGDHSDRLALKVDSFSVSCFEIDVEEIVSSCLTVVGDVLADIFVLHTQNTHGGGLLRIFKLHKEATLDSSNPREKTHLVVMDDRLDASLGSSTEHADSIVGRALSWVNPVLSYKNYNTHTDTNHTAHTHQQQSWCLGS